MNILLIAIISIIIWQIIGTTVLVFMFPNKEDEISLIFSFGLPYIFIYFCKKLTYKNKIKNFAKTHNYYAIWGDGVLLDKIYTTPLLAERISYLGYEVFLISEGNKSWKNSPYKDEVVQNDNLNKFEERWEWKKGEWE